MSPVPSAGANIRICQLHLGPSSLSVVSALCLPTTQEAASRLEEIVSLSQALKSQKLVWNQLSEILDFPEPQLLC